MNGDIAELEIGETYYEQKHDREVVPRVALASEVYFTEVETGARFRRDRDDVEAELEADELVLLDETAEVLA